MILSRTGVRVDDEDITSAVRTGEMDRAAAIVSTHPGVRAVLVRRQREYGADGGLVMEGRDIGTVVFPDADVEVFLSGCTSPGAGARLATRARS